MEISTEHAPLAPEGGSFIIDRCRFVPGETLEIAAMDINEGRLYDWHMVYILANSEEAYVGETVSVVRRMREHGENPEKHAFTTVNIIFSPEANKSMILDYESRLIRYMSADGRYVLTNKNNGIEESDYYSKAEYDAMFEDLWSELRKHELADHGIDWIEESEVFKYSPYKSLNEDQRFALDKIMSVIRGANEEKRPIVVEGLPGTGKTILAVYLLKMLRDAPFFSGMNVRILEPVDSLRGSLKNAVRRVQNLSTKDVLGPSDLVKDEFAGGKGRKPFDILLVDEAHRLKQRKNIVAYKSFDKTDALLGLEEDAKPTQLDWVLKQAEIPILFYDPMQVVGPSGIDPDIMSDRLGISFEHPIRLESQMRVKGGNEYLGYVADILWDRNPAPRAFDDYEFVLHEGFRGFHESFERHLNEHALTRMIAGYAWKWRTKKDASPDVYDIEIEGSKLRWNSSRENWVGRGVDDPAIAREVGVIHTIQGYDLSFAYVIVGPDLVYDEARGRIACNRDSYFDVNGKNNTTDEELEEYIKRIYYVLMTRGISGTHVYVCDDALRRRFRDYFEVVE